jgi:hypothetical protein
MRHRFSDAAQDVVDARIYEGIHFRFANEEAWKQGTRVAKMGLRELPAASRRRRR